MRHTKLKQYLTAIETLPTNKPLSKEDLLTDNFLIDKDGHLKMYFAPHNEYINKEAQIVIVGITPGFSQMKTAFEQFIQSKLSDKSLEECLIETKQVASFSGSMRVNLIQMLNDCGLPGMLGLKDASELFQEYRDLIHTTSVIKYPTFIDGKNYTGHQPPIERSSLLKHYAYSVFPEELSQITPNALIIPLGKTVDSVMAKLADENKLSGHDYLAGFPHPSGANGHRIRQFQQQKQILKEQVQAWKNDPF